MTALTRARAEASDAARTAGVEVTLAESHEAAREIVAVLAEVWPRSDGQLPLLPELAWALAHADCYVAAAHVGDRIIGGAIAFRGADAAGPLLHSHMTGVLPDVEGKRVGTALKLDQRAWALETGLTRITWTFDPLVARNAYFNLVKLGAQVTDYYVDFYGALGDGLNAGDETDRFLVVWDLTAQRGDDDGGVDVAAARRAGAVVALDVADDTRPLAGSVTGGQVLVRVPPDIVELRDSRPDLAREWRLALRAVMSPALAAGYRIAGVGREGWYLLGRD
jgi:predicted GNAT superfamily acetyltransferase